MLTNCFRFAPRDSVPGLIDKICKYLKDHPGWSEEELEEQIKQFIEQPGSGGTSDGSVLSVNNQSGDVILDVVDVSENDSVNEFAKLFINENEEYPITPAIDSDALGGKPPSYYATNESVNKLKQQKVNYTDALTLEEIQASTDLAGKIPAASALAQVVENQRYTLLGDSGQSNVFTYNMSTLTVPAGLYEFIGGVQFALLSRDGYGIWRMIKALNEADTSSIVDNQLSLYMGTWFGKCYYKRLVDA